MYISRTLLIAVITAATTWSVTAQSNSQVQTPTSSQVQTSAPADLALQQQIEAKLDADKTLKAYGIDVSVSEGVATLTGVVETDAQKTRAARVARVKGVKKVVNDVTLDANAKSLKTRLKEAGASVAGAAKAGAEVAAEKTKEGLSRSAEAVNDGMIITKVRTRFGTDDVLKGSDIEVKSENHVVTLKGTVSSEAQRQHAIEVAKTTEGVASVVDQLVIR